MKNVLTKHTSLNLPRLLWERAVNVPQIFVTGKQAYIPLMNALLFCLTQTKKSCMEKLPRLQSLRQNYHTENDTVKIYPSLPLFLLEVAGEKYQTENRKLSNTDLVELALLDILHTEINMDEWLTGLPFPYPFSGTKNQEVCSVAYGYLEKIWSTPDKRHYIEPFTGSGALFFALPLKENWMYTLNDLDANKINFLRTVKYRLPELLEKIWALLKSPQRLIKAESYLPLNFLHKWDNTKYPNHLDVEMASRYYVYCHQKRHKNSENLNNTAYRQLAFLPLYSAKLRKADVHLLCMDALSVMDTSLAEFGTAYTPLFLVDSPYPMTEHYFRDVDENFYRKHLILSKRCHRLAESGGVFLYFCRSTPPTALYKKLPHKVPQLAGKLQRKIDSLYSDRGYFRMEYPLNDFVTEVLISNHEGTGSKLY